MTRDSNGSPSGGGSERAGDDGSERHATVDDSERSADNGRGLDRPVGARGVPDFEAARRHVLTELLRFAGRLRAGGVEVPATGGLDGARALAAVGLADREPVAAALRATMLSEAGDVERFEEEFPTFWHRLRTGLDRIATDDDGLSPSGDETESETDEPADPADGDPELLSDASPPSFESGDPPDGVSSRVATDRRHATRDRPASSGDDDARRYSAAGRSEPIEADPPALSERESAAIDRFVAALATLPGRRTRPAAAGGRVDARRALRGSLGTGGTVVELPTREPALRELRCCLLVDVSGSVLDTVDRGTLLAFAERLQTTARSGRVFLFDTDLVDATDQFARADGDPAAALREAEVVWGGGTRIGRTLDALRRRHPHAVDRRTVVVVVSDGLDVGDPELLEAGVTWLSSRASALVWLNPLAVSPEYEPRSRGMATSLPYVDGLFGFAGPADLDEAARQLERRGVGGSVGYEHDPRRIRDGGD